MRGDPKPMGQRISIAIPTLVLLFGGLLLQQEPMTDKPASSLEIKLLREKLQAQLYSLHAGAQFPGATAGIALPDGSSLGLATGFSDKAKKISMTPADLMLQGSVGKTYVAAVALQFVDEGGLRLDDKVKNYLGGAPWYPRLPNADEITVRQLMNHTSGLVRYEFNEAFISDLVSQPDKVWKPEELVFYILDTKAPFVAGEGWEYSDTNYIVLGMILEKLGASKYYDLLKTRILGPLGLRHTVPSDSRTIPGLVQGYAGAGNPFGGRDEMFSDGRFVFNPQFEWTGGGIASTAEDLARWAKDLYEGRAFDPSLLPEMLNAVPAKLGPNVKYGLGAIVRQTPLGPGYGHSGYFPGYLTEMMYFPEIRTAVAVQVNTSVPRAIGKPLIQIIYDLAQIIKNEMAHDEASAAHSVGKENNGEKSGLLSEEGRSIQEGGPYLGQKPPGTSPEVFGPGIVSTEQREFNIIISPDGKEIYFSRTTAGSPTAIMVVLERNGRWTEPQIAPFSGTYSDMDPSMSPDGRMIFFGSTRPSGKENAEGCDIWVTQRTSSGGWSEPRDAGDTVNTAKNENYPVMAKSGNLYFQSNGHGGRGGLDIFRSEYKDGLYGKPENLGKAVNSGHNDFDAFVDPDESYIIFSSADRPEGFGSGDLYISFRKSDGRWTPAQNMGAGINSPSLEYCPKVSPDGRFLFFSSGRSGRGDVYWVDAKIIEQLRPESAP
jgi:D-alanyl-D-alanine carboxypeptidase